MIIYVVREAGHESRWGWSSYDRWEVGHYSKPGLFHRLCVSAKWAEIDDLGKRTVIPGRRELLRSQAVDIARRLNQGRPVDFPDEA